MLELSLYCLL